MTADLRSVRLRGPRGWKNLEKRNVLSCSGTALSVAGEAPRTRIGHVDFGGIVKEINLAFVPDAQVGEYVLVHIGFALTVIDESEAAQVFEHLREMGELLDSEAGRSREGFA
jgi:hydrogenase expression/formation protein HypC